MNLPGWAGRGHAGLPKRHQHILEVTSGGQAVRYAAYSAPVAPELFAIFVNGARYAAAVYPDGSYVGSVGVLGAAATRPAKPGDVISLFGAGFGRTNPVADPGVVVREPRAGAHPLVRGPAQGGDIGRRRGASRQTDVAQELRADLRGRKVVLGKPTRRAAVTLIITVDRLDGGEGLVLV